MDSTIIKNWNERVKPEDTVFHLGDFCLAPKTYIDTPNGQKQIRNLNVGDKVYSVNIQPENRYNTKMIETAIVTQTFISESDYRLRIHFGNNSKIDITENHPIAISKNGIIYWTRAGKVKVGDVAFHRTDIPATIIEKWFKSYKMGYIWGYIKGDGHIDKNDNVDIQSKDTDGINRVKSFVKELYGIDLSINICRNKYYRIRIPRKIMFSLKISDLALIEINKRNEEWNRGFIAGFYDAEGSLSFQSENWFISICNTDLNLLQCIKSKLDFFGFDCIVSTYQPKGKISYKTLQTLKLYTKDTCNFCLLFRPALKRKYPDLKVVANGTKVTKIEKIYHKYGKKFKNYNISVEPNNNYLAKGILVHNCFRNTKGGKVGEGTPNRAEFYQAQLNGNIVYVMGNHDGNNSLNTKIKNLVIEYGGKDYFCCHKPEDADFQNYSICLCGHVHDGWKSHIWPDGAFIVNVGTDVWNYRPVSMEEIMKHILDEKRKMNI